ncbi:MAG: hypothetical protein WBG08_04720 [Litorimonas sp.]
MRTLETTEIGEVAGGPFVLLVIPAVKLTTGAKTAAVALGGAAGIAGATAALSNNDSSGDGD